MTRFYTWKIPRHSIKKLIETYANLMKSQDRKIIRQPIVIFLYNNNVLAEREARTEIPFIHRLKKLTRVGINFNPRNK